LRWGGKVKKVNPPVLAVVVVVDVVVVVVAVVPYATTDVEAGVVASSGSVSGQAFG
jgi:hypothetical protein